MGWSDLGALGALGAATGVLVRFLAGVFAGAFASLACLLFLGALYSDHAMQTKAKPQASAAARGA